MPKLKTHSGSSKRFRITGTGKVIRKRAFKRHNLTKKSASRKRVINTLAQVTGNNAKNIKQALGV